MSASWGVSRDHFQRSPCDHNTLFCTYRQWILAICASRNAASLSFETSAQHLPHKDSPLLTAPLVRRHFTLVTFLLRSARFAPVVDGGDLRSGQLPARKGLIEEPDCRAILVSGQDLEAAEGMPAPGPVAGRLETASRLVVGVAASARLAGLQWRGCLVVDVLPALNACPDGIRQHLCESLHLGRGIPRIDEARAFDYSLESGHDHLCSGWVTAVR